VIRVQESEGGELSRDVIIGSSPPGASRKSFSTIRTAAVALVAAIVGGTVVALTIDRTPAAPVGARAQPGAATIAPRAGGGPASARWAAR
jgi:uncharacterized membrane protein YeiH